MKIFVYARSISYSYGGLTEYIKSMIKNLIPLLAPSDSLIIVHNLSEPVFSNSAGNVEEILFKTRNRIIADYLVGPYLIHKIKPDIAWFPSNVIPFFVNAKKINTVLDLGYFFPKLKAYTFWDSVYQKLMISSSCLRADKIVAISGNTKKDIKELVHIEDKKIKVIYLAADSRFAVYDKSRLSQVRDKYRLHKKFILFTGALTPRKNLVRVIKAFNKVNALTENEICFVLTGSESIGWNNKDVLNLISQNDKIIRIGFVSDEELPYLYNLAELFVYPSLYEGFGLPIIESQSCGCPVITSDRGSCPEVAGEGALIVNPYCVDDIYQGILKILSDREFRQNLISRGFENVKRFSWELAANELLNLMRKVAD